MNDGRPSSLGSRELETVESRQRNVIRASHTTHIGSAPRHALSALGAGSRRLADGHYGCGLKFNRETMEGAPSSSMLIAKTLVFVPAAATGGGGLCLLIQLEIFAIPLEAAVRFRVGTLVFQHQLIRCKTGRQRRRLGARRQGSHAASRTIERPQRRTNESGEEAWHVGRRYSSRQFFWTRLTTTAVYKTNYNSDSERRFRVTVNT